MTMVWVKQTKNKKQKYPLVLNGYIYGSRFDLEQEIEYTQSKLPNEEQEAFETEILDNIKYKSLPLGEKLKIVR